jgi:UDP-N-acetylmuramyl tripeptide synthase
VRLPLSAEIVACARAARLSRLTAEDGGTTVPGKLLWKLDPGAIDRLARAAAAGPALVSATNGKTTTAAMAREILAPAHALAHNASGANLVSGVASDAPRATAPSSGSSRSTRRRCPEVARASRRGVCLGNLFRDQLDRYGELELVAERWRAAVARCRGDALVVNGDDPQVGELAAARRARRLRPRRPAHARPSLQHAADSKYCVACGTPYEYAAAYVGHLGDYRCPLRPRAARSSTSSRATSSSPGSSARRSRSRRPRGRARRARAARALQRLQRARRRALARALGVRWTTSRAGSSASAPRSAASSGSRSATRPADAPDQEPGRRERGDPHARRGGAAALA